MCVAGTSFASEWWFEAVMSRSQLLTWEVAGSVFIVALGIPLHSVFAWAGQSHFIAWLAPVNESTWEHFKLCYWPAALFALLQRPFVETNGSFWKAKTIAQITMPVSITVIFYGYTAILGRHELAADIVVFVLSVAIGQYVSYRTLISGTPAGKWWVGVFLLTALSFVWFAYSPPHFFLFKDPITSDYGIPRK